MPIDAMNPPARLSLCLVLALIGAMAPACAAPPEELKNWFDDPFFQVRSGLPDCPLPLGPLMSEAQRRAEAHYRVERGTSCWLEGKCTQPNAYWYDATIGKAIGQRFAASAEFADTSLWITVQRRFVTVQGCISRREQAQQIEALLQEVPDVERVIVELMAPDDAKAPYRVAPAGHAARP